MRRKALSPFTRAGQWPPRRRQVLLLIPAFALIGVIWAGEIWLIATLQAARCPAGTFLSASPPTASVVIALATVFPALGFGFLAANAVAHAIPAARRYFDPDAGRRGEEPYRRTQSALWAGSAWIAAILLPIAFAASFQQFCLSPAGLSYRSAPWGELRDHAWNEVTAVTTSCARAGRGGWVGRYVLTLRESERIDVMGGFASLWRVRPQLAAALHGRPLVFDASRVDPRCRISDIGMLLSRP